MPLISAQRDGNLSAHERPQTSDPAPAPFPPSLSLVGAPPSPVGREDRLRRLLGDEELSLDVGQIYREVKEHPADLIMKERPDFYGTRLVTQVFLVGPEGWSVPSVSRSRFESQ